MNKRKVTDPFNVTSAFGIGILEYLPLTYPSISFANANEYF